MRRACYRMRSPWVLLQALLCGGALATAVLWLAMPDVTVADEAVSAVLFLVGTAACAWAEAAILIAAGRAGERRSAWQAAVWLVAVGAVYGLAVMFLRAGSLQDRERAYLLDQRTLLWHLGGVPVLLQMQGVVWWLLQWGLAGALLPLLLEGVARGRVTWKAWTAPMRHGLYWLVLLSVAAVGTWMTGVLLAFRPAVPLPVQISLTLVRLATLFAEMVGGLCLTISLTATYLRDSARESASGRTELRPREGTRRLGRVRPERKKLPQRW